MREKIKLCWKWSGGGEEKQAWIKESLAPAAEHFEIYAEERERTALVAAGMEPQTLGADWGEGSQALLLAMAASGEAGAVIWIDEEEGCANLTAYATRLCRQKKIALAIEPVGASAMLAGMAGARDLGAAGPEDNHGQEEGEESLTAEDGARPSRKAKTGFAHKRRVEVKKRLRASPGKSAGKGHGAL